MKLNKEDLSSIQLECSHYENTRAASIEALKIIQKRQGWVSDDAIKLVAQVLHISESDVEGVATFYNQIFRQPVGKHVVRYCDSNVCYITGCEKIQRILESILNIEIGNTTQDNKFTLLPMCCVGLCDKSPIVMIDENVYSCVVPSEVIQVLKVYL